jgi:hypothetical protein
MILRDDQIQAAFLSHLKSSTVLTSEVVADQIRETQLQSTDFVYPGIRLRVEPGVLEEDGCPQNVTIRIAAFSENSSSQQALRISGIIRQQYHSKSFSATGIGQSMTFTGIKVTVIPVVRQDQRTWRAELLLNMIVSSG